MSEHPAAEKAALATEREGLLEGRPGDVEWLEETINAAIEEGGTAQQQRIEKLEVALLKIQAIEQAKLDAWVQSRKDGFDADTHEIAKEALKSLKGGDADETG